MATNRSDTLDPTLLRPGRLDRKIEFPLPDRHQKRLICSTITCKINLSDEVDFEDCILSVCMCVYICALCVCILMYACTCVCIVCMCTCVSVCVLVLKWIFVIYLLSDRLSKKADCWGDFVAISVV